MAELASTTVYGDLKVMGDTYGIIPVGGIFKVPSTVVPTGFIACNGALISRTSYSRLFSVIGTTFGVGDGSTTFQLPTITETNYTYYIKY